jgi:hypothetical protein
MGPRRSADAACLAAQTVPAQRARRPASQRLLHAVAVENVPTPRPRRQSALQRIQAQGAIPLGDDHPPLRRPHAVVLVRVSALLAPHRLRKLQLHADHYTKIVNLLEPKP